MRRWQGTAVVTGLVFSLFVAVHQPDESGQLENMGSVSSHRTLYTGLAHLFSRFGRQLRMPDMGVVAAASLCPTGPAVAIGGIRRLALLVGISKYQDPDSDLPGAAGDAQRIYNLLTGPNGYGFPKENVCLLLNQNATVAGFRGAFDSALINRARSGDLAVFYYAGHGSQTRDRNGDEPDEYDETLMLYDSRHNGQHDLVDDELNGKFADLYAKTRNIVAIFDSCNSGSVTRDGIAKVRYKKPEAYREGEGVGEQNSGGDGATGFGNMSMPGIVTISAAADGTSATETDGAGIFTSALVKVLNTIGRVPLTWSQVSLRVPPLIAAAHSLQIPYFQGDLSKEVFGVRARVRPVGWQVTAINGKRFTLRGTALPGWSPGAELRVYEGAAAPADILNPAKALATLELTSITGVRAEAQRIDLPRPDQLPIQNGALAVLVRPGIESLTLKVRLRPASRAGGVPPERAKAIRSALETNQDIRGTVKVVSAGAAFELLVREDGRLQLLGPEGSIRNTFSAERSREAAQVSRSLWQHARQQALLQLEGEGGSDFVNNETLKVELLPAPLQSECARGTWLQSAPNQEQMIPLCHQAMIKVSLSEASPSSLIIGGLLLASDGGLYGFPRAGELIKLVPGSSHRFSSQDVYKASLPLDVRDYLMVFGTPEDQQILWRDFTDPTVTGNGTPDTTERGALTPLRRALGRYLRKGGMRGELGQGIGETSTWTSTVVPIRPVANSRFLGPEGISDPRSLMREYTIASFDVRPYLPDNHQSALFRVLQKEYSLTHYSRADGVPYGQHNWSLPTDKQNLKRGIDCSRAIWFAFTRAGLPYNKTDRYLTTGEMVGFSSPMSDAFDSCQAEADIQLGDVLVYRDEGRKIGHVVMVIDAEKRIAWGSHGWDGNVREREKGLDVVVDRGVEYQRIKYKKDWERWDLKAMKRVACWRHKRFVEEATAPGGRPGTAALEGACDPRKCKEQ